MKYNLRSVYQTDKEKEKQGVWIENIGAAGFDMKIASANTARFEEVSRKEQRPYERLIRQRKLGREVRNMMQAKIFAKAIVRDWRGLRDDDDVDPEVVNKWANELGIDASSAGLVLSVLGRAKELGRTDILDDIAKNGKEIPFSYEECVALLTAYPLLVEDINAVASDTSGYLDDEVVKESEGNLSGT